MFRQTTHSKQKKTSRVYKSYLDFQTYLFINWIPFTYIGLKYFKVFIFSYFPNAWLLKMYFLNSNNIHCNDLAKYIADPLLFCVSQNIYPLLQEVSGGDIIVSIQFISISIKSSTLSNQQGPATMCEWRQPGHSGSCYPTLHWCIWQ